MLSNARTNAGNLASRTPLRARPFPVRLHTPRARARSQRRQLLRSAIRERLRDVLWADRVRAGKRSDRRGHSRDAVPAAPGQRQLVDRASEQVLGWRVPTRACRFRAGHARFGHGRSPAPTTLPAALRGRALAGRGTTTIRSKRSSSARESLFAYAASRCDEHEQAALGSPRAPQGQRFIVPSSWKDAGYSAVPSARATLITPSSSGWRSASSAGRTNSGSSSSKRTPRCARLASPGRGPRPPPTIAGADAVWCGARNGGVVISGCSGGRSPATEWIRVTSSDSPYVERR